MIGKGFANAVFGDRFKTENCVEDFDRVFIRKEGGVVYCVDNQGGLHMYEEASGEALTEGNNIWVKSRRKLFVSRECKQNWKQNIGNKVLIRDLYSCDEDDSTQNVSGVIESFRVDIEGNTVVRYVTLSEMVVGGKIWQGKKEWNITDFSFNLLEVQL